LKSLNNLDNKELIPIGKIVRTHGVHGKLRVAYYNEDKASFLSYQEVFLRNSDRHLGSLEIVEAKVHRKFILVQFKGIENLDEAERLVGATVLVKKVALPQLEEGEYYWTDLIGMEVATPEGECLGRLSQIIPTGGTDVFVVKQGEREILLPANEERIEHIDTASRRIVVSLLEGLVSDDSV
jgi:16S rRNA processing protein RimM